MIKPIRIGNGLTDVAGESYLGLYKYRDINGMKTRVVETEEEKRLKDMGYELIGVITGNERTMYTNQHTLILQAYDNDGKRIDNFFVVYKIPKNNQYSHL